MIHTAHLLLALGVFLAAQAGGAWTDTTIVADDQKPSQKEEVLAADSYAVQVGRFGNENMAQELAATLRQEGYQPHVLAARDAEGKVWHAVRLSLHDSLEQARQAASSFMQQEGRSAVVAISGSTSPVPASGELYFLQAGAFVERENAQKRLNTYKDQGFDAGIVQLYDKDKQLFYIVYVGVYDKLPDAQQAAKTFRDKAGEPCYINAIAPDLFQRRLDAAR